MATNFEHYKKELLKVAERNDDFAMFENTIVPCHTIHCDQCNFLKSDGCILAKVKFLYAEHVEKPKLTKAERAFLECTKAKYIARDKNGNLYIYSVKPTKKKGLGWNISSLMQSASLYPISEPLFNVSFPYIKWEDEEPWSIEDLLKLEVEE